MGSYVLLSYAIWCAAIWCADDEILSTCAGVCVCVCVYLCRPPLDHSIAATAQFDRAPHRDALSITRWTPLANPDRRAAH